MSGPAGRPRPLSVPCLLALGLAFLAPGAGAQSLTMGVGSPVSSLDPHYHQLRSNAEVSQMLFDPLIRSDAKARLQPGLAESWRPLGTEGWELRLREGVTFHDGTPFTAEDVAFTIARIPTLAGPGASYGTHVRPIARVEVVDARTVRLHTTGPSPLLPVYLSQFTMLGRRLHDGASTADFNSGRAAIGTGPFRLRSHSPNDRIVVERNDAYWDGKAPWQQVTYRILTNNAARVAALLAGDVDVIDQVPPADLARIRRDARFHVEETTSLRAMYVTLDLTREGAGPLTAAHDGSPLPRNPLADRRVRQALALAVDRPALVDRVMTGVAVASAQFMPEGTPTSLPGLATPPGDPEGARRLLAEAGYPEGFQMTLIGSNDRYINDSRVVQAIGQMWTRIGVRTTVEAQPYATFIGRATRREAPAALLTWGNSTGEISVMLNSVLRTVDRERGHGAANRTHYSSAAMDGLLARAETEMDDGRREGLLQEATRVVLDDLPIIPLYLLNAQWAMKAGLRYEARVDGKNDPMTVRPAP